MRAVASAVTAATARLSRSSLYLLLPCVLNCAWAAESIPAGSYEVTIEMGMPHLEENLRYATVRETQCLPDQALASTFPILGHAALNGCTLGDERRDGDMVFYLLLCEGGQGTTGGASWRVGKDRVSGTLEVKLGGKNMTLYQRFTARRLGECGSEG